MADLAAVGHNRPEVESSEGEPSGSDSRSDGTLEGGARTQGGVEPAPTEAPDDVPMSLLERYEMRERLGAGALGIVYAAWDPELERRVAIKLVRPKLRKPSRSEKVRVRILREAQSLARLSHPNVVKVYDVGRYDDDGERAGVFLVMELLEGQTLGAWFQSPRTTDETIEVFLQAGRGLAAAHGSNLVHRDFKPDNVMVTRGPRAKVLDFGLARVPEQSTESVRVEPVSEQQPVTFEISGEMVRLTQTGVVLGTPRYMAPEQYADADVGQAADQFAFCLAFLEALQGSEVYVGESYGELAAAKRQGDFAPRPTGDTTPDWLRSILERGLHPNPAHRWRSMDDLLVAIGRGPSRRRWIYLTGGVVLVGGAAGAAAWAGGSPSECGTGTTLVEQRWTPEVQQKTRDALLAASADYGALAWDDARGVLGDYAERWREIYGESCAARSSGALSDRGFDRRMACLRARELAFGTAVDVLAEADETTAVRAHDVATSMPSLELCSDDDALEDEISIPVDPEVARGVAEFRGTLARAETLASAGRFDSARLRLDGLDEQATVLGYPPLESEYLLAVGKLESASGDYEAAHQNFERALLAAERHGHDWVAAEAALWILDTVGIRLARPAEALREVGRAESLVERLGRPARLRARLLGQRGRIYNLASRYDEAHVDLEAALEILISSEERSELELADALSNLALNSSSQGRNAQAIARMREGLSIAERVLGPQHPTTASFTQGLADVHYAAEDHDAARLMYSRTIRIVEGSLGKDHPRLVPALIGWGGIESNERKFDEAREAYDRAMKIAEAAFGSDHVEIGEILTAMSANEVRANNIKRSIELDQRALLIYEKALGPDHHKVGIVLGMLGWHQRVDGREAEGQETLERALKILEARVGDEHPSVVNAWMLLGYAANGEKRYDEAEGYFNRALEYSERHGGPDHPSVARALYGLINLYQARNEWARSEPLLRRVLKILISLRETGPFRARARERLHAALWEQGKRAEAIAEAALAKEEIDRGVLPVRYRKSVEAALTEYRAIVAAEASAG